MEVVVLGPRRGGDAPGHGADPAGRPLDPTDAESFDHSFTTRLGRLDVVPRIAGAYGLPYHRLPGPGTDAAVLRLRGTRKAIAATTDLAVGTSVARWRHRRGTRKE